MVRWWLTVQRVLLTKQYDLLITWFCEITWQTQTIFSPYYDFRWGTFAHRSHDHLIMQSSKSQKLKPLYLHYQIVLAVWWLTLRGSYSCSHKALSIITWFYYITQQTKNRSLLPQYLWSPNLAWWWHGVRRLKLHEPSIRWCCEATWKKFIFPLALDQWPPNKALIHETNVSLHDNLKNLYHCKRLMTT